MTHAKEKAPERSVERIHVKHARQANKPDTKASPFTLAFVGGRNAGSGASRGLLSDFFLLATLAALVAVWGLYWNPPGKRGREQRDSDGPHQQTPNSRLLMCC